jgi:acyl carrier protein
MGKGFVDSTGILEVVGFIEESFGFRVEDNEFLPDNLDSVNNLTGYISSKYGNMRGQESVAATSM